MGPEGRDDFDIDADLPRGSIHVTQRPGDDEGSDGMDQEENKGIQNKEFGDVKQRSISYAFRINDSVPPTAGQKQPEVKEVTGADLGEALMRSNRHRT